MKYSDFFRFLRKWREYKKYPPASGWPAEINLDSKAWEGIQKIYNLTKMDNHEYETSVFFVEGETYLTTPQRGTRDHVNASHQLQVKYVVDQKKRVYIRNVVLDGNIIAKSTIKPEKMPQQTDIGFLFNVHTHPEHLNQDSLPTYSFFSDTDIRTLLASDAMITGLVTDSFWFAAKTDQAISQVGEVGEELLMEISQRAFAGEIVLDEIIQKNMSRWGLVFYRGDFRRPLKRIN